MHEELHQVQKTIAQACDAAHRSVDEITLIAVSKTWPSERLAPLVTAGQTVFGENKLQELEQKTPALPSSLQWHFIGQLQRNKVRKVLRYSKWIHSVGSEKLLSAIDRIAEE